MHRGLASLFVMFGTAIVLRFAALAQAETSPRVALDAQTHYLSTEPARATIEIDNVTNREIGYSSLSVTFLIRDSTGHQREDRWIKSITHLPGVSWIAPGRQQSFATTLPSCEVEIDPCSQQVAVKLGLYVRASNGIDAVTNEVKYTFAPDPTATFRIDGLRNDRPLLIMRGDARDVIPANIGVVDIRFAGEPPTDTDAMLNRIVKQHGLTINDTGGDEEGDQQFDVVVDNQGIQPPPNAELEAIAGDVRRHYGSRIQSVATYYIPDVNFGFQHVFQLADSAARESADVLANLLQITPLVEANFSNGSSTKIQLNPRSDDEDPNSPFVAFGGLQSGASVSAQYRSQLPALLDVWARETQAYLGAHSTTGPNLVAARSASPNEYLADGLQNVEPLPVQAVVAADRPQVFALGFTTLQESAQRGADPNALALILALHRARALATQLGVGTRDVSLAARYANIDWAPDRTLLGFGVALTVSGEPAAAWHRRAIPTPHASRAPARPIPSNGKLRIEPLPSPLFSPRPVPAPTRPPIAQASQITPPDVIPIDAPDAANLIVSEGDVTETAHANELRLSVAISSGVETPDERLRDLPDSTTIQRQLRAQPDVVDAAVQETAYAPLPVAYDLVLRTWDRVRIQRLVTMIGSRYQRFPVALKFGTALILSDCEKQVMQAQRASVDQAEVRAIRTANDQKRRLRRLILAAAYPPITGDFCAVSALPEAIDRARDNTVILPANRSVELHVPVKLIFRTYSAPLYKTVN